MADSRNLMKTLLCVSLLTVLSCKRAAKQGEKDAHVGQRGKESRVDTATVQAEATKPGDRSAYYITKDSLLIATETGDTLIYGRDEFNTIVDTHPELYSDDIRYPDLTFYCNGSRDAYNSEAGQDVYYVLYAYFLKQKNGIDKYAMRRKRLIDIYSNINLLFARLHNGGTFFGHQGLRILGYAEYSIYVYKLYEKDISEPYDISKQKDLYIKSLRLLYSDGSKNTEGLLDPERRARIRDLNAIVDNISKAITDNFYLQRAQEFHYDHYQYY
ncbi:hypothetical protein A3860_09715 [Niastella vici]|uniref:Uncharacterized protein n=2 Tax=Niastella vici TaxID=1703345 RepID=A0A1V9FF03_9BACT|nr:hypothetical protein A3860_09715 [Niastella vici]